MSLSITDILVIALIGLMAGVAGAAGFHRFAGAGAQPEFVTFDVTKLTNAQRQVAAGLLNDDPDAISTVRRAGRQAMSVIEDFAGGRTVVVRQAFVASQIPDITEQVLEELGLPTDVPSISATARLEHMDGTNYGSDPNIRTLSESRDEAVRLIRRQAERENEEAGDGSSTLIP